MDIGNKDHQTGRLIPAWLAERGFTLGVFAGVEALLPPSCPVPGGTFLMGRAPKRDLPDPREYEPQHAVEVAAFAIGRYLVTVAEYLCFVEAGGEPPASQGWQATWQDQQRQPEHPVVHATWHQATAYARWVAGLTGQSWRLPTEAEWEKAARWDDAAQQARVYPWGDRYDRTRANTKNHGPNTTTPVGSYPAGQSPGGALDMAGNVYEWTSSYFLPYPYDAQDGRESPQAGPPSAYYRIRRGGSWGDSWHYARCAHRNFDIPSLSTAQQGFRLACDLASVSPASPAY